MNNDPRAESEIYVKKFKKMTEDDHCRILMEDSWPETERYVEIAERLGYVKWVKKKLAPIKVVEKIIRDYA